MKFPESFTFITDEVSQNLPDVVRMVKEFKLPGIELRSMSGRAFKDLTPADIAEVKRTAQAEGWKVFGCSSPVFKCDLDDAAAIQANIDQFKRSVAVANELGSDLVRVFTFLRRPVGQNIPLVPRVAEHLQKLRSIAADARVRIGIENEHSCVVGSAAEAAALFGHLPQPEFGLVWDPCNVLYVPGGPEKATEDFEKIRPRIFHIHAKDARRVTPKPGALHAVATPVGLGDVCWRTHLREIINGGYRGMISLETHWRVQQLAEESLHLPAGYGFSKGGEEATRVCLHNLRMLLPDAV
ncbi:MAG: sugar phosphate isomerase/epimerase family protein [Opitutaceae bacterium]|nr:sugar phosphate isomerase/epimerase family protein [Opitutaceae bacterium]